MKNFYSLASALLLTTCHPAVAQQTCVPRADAVETLQGRFAERRVGIGMSGTIVIEVWANDETGTGTITVTRPDGTTCLVAAIEHWTHLDEAPPAEGIDG